MSQNEHEHLRLRRLQALGLVPRPNPPAEDVSNPVFAGGPSDPVVAPVGPSDPVVAAGGPSDPVVAAGGHGPNDPVVAAGGRGPNDPVVAAGGHGPNDPVVAAVERGPNDPVVAAVGPNAQIQREALQEEPHISLTFKIYPNDRNSMVDVVSSLARTLAGLCSVGAREQTPCAMPVAAEKAPTNYFNNDSWLSDYPVNQSTPKSDGGVVVIPSEDSDLFVSDEKGAGARPSPKVAPATGAIRKVPCQAGPSTSTGASSKPSGSKYKFNSSTSASELNYDLNKQPQAANKGDKGLMSQMAAFFRLQKSKEKNKERGTSNKHFLSDSSETSQEIMPKKKMRTAAAQPEPQPAEPEDDDPHIGRCPVCLDRPKNCKIRCKHLFCEKCLQKLKDEKKGCPFDGFRFRTWEKLF